MTDNDQPLDARPDDPYQSFRNIVEGFAGRSRGLSGPAGDAWEPPMDVYETHEKIVIKLSLPGVKACDVHVLFNGDTVTISGHRNLPRESGTVAYHQMEIRSGYFERRVVIQKPFEPQEASAQYRDGFLTIYIPKTRARAHTVYSLRLRI
jgi:HSP20 family protein